MDYGIFNYNTFYLGNLMLDYGVWVVGFFFHTVYLWNRLFILKGFFKYLIYSSEY